MRSRAHTVRHRGHHPGLIGRIGNLTEDAIHQATVDALLGFQPLGHLDPEFVAHLIGGQTAHLVIGSVNLILGAPPACGGQRENRSRAASPVTNCPIPQRYRPHPPQGRRQPSPTPRLWMKTDLWITRDDKQLDVGAKC
jgi:hypothetical protein